MDYSKMSDFEINGLVAAKTQRAGDYTQAREKNFIHEYADVGELKGICVGWKEFDPCKNPADAWPIIAERKICLAFDVFAEPQDGGAWVASPAYGYEVERVRHDNPLRAAMVVLLMMQEDK